jgi:hypothetical protein
VTAVGDVTDVDTVTEEAIDVSVVGSDDVADETPATSVSDSVMEVLPHAVRKTANARSARPLTRAPTRR